MKKLIMLLIAGAITAASVHAQDVPQRKGDGFKAHEGMRKGHGKDLAKLNLSPEQKTQFKSLNEAYRKQVADLKSQDNLTVKDSREKMIALRKDHRAKVQALLTPEQKAQLEKNKQERMAKMEKAGKERAEKMKQELNLTPAQSARLEESRKSSAAKLKAIRDNQSLSDQEKMQQSKEIRKQQKEAMKSILTPEQLKKFQESKHKNKPRKGGFHQES